jgi:outer membrane protein TolC
MAQLEYDLAVENVVSSDSLYFIGSERLKIASISQADLLTLKLDALNAKNTLETVSLNLKRAMLSFLAFMDMPKDTELKLELPQYPARISVTPDQALRLSQENNPDYLQYQLNVLAAERAHPKENGFRCQCHCQCGF